MIIIVVVVVVVEEEEEYVYSARRNIYVIIIIIIIIIINANGFIPGCIVLQCKAGQYNTIRYNTITHIAQK